MDIFTVENRKLCTAEEINYFMETNIMVYLDDELVFNGSVDGFLIDNQYQEDIVDYMRELFVKDELEFNEISGYWYIVKN